MKEIIKGIVCWACVILSLVAFIRLVILGDQILGATGIVVFNLSAIIVIMKEAEDGL